MSHPLNHFVMRQTSALIIQVNYNYGIINTSNFLDVFVPAYV
jgi:hypothetical protein